MQDEKGREEAELEHGGIPEVVEAPETEETILEKLRAVRTKREEACVKEIDAALDKYGCQFAPTVVPQMRADGVVIFPVKIDVIAKSSAQ